MTENDKEITADPTLSGQQPTVEETAPGGGGTRSGSAAGGNKRDPMSSGPTLGHTIAGRDIDTESNTSDTNANPNTPQE